MSKGIEDATQLQTLVRLELGRGPKDQQGFYDLYEQLRKQRKCFMGREAAVEFRDNPGFTVITEPTILELVVVTPPQLGFERGGTPKDCYERAQERLGLSLCPPETPLQIVTQYGDMPKCEGLTIAMKPLSVALWNGAPGAYFVYRMGDGPFELRFIGAKDDDLLDKHTKLVFVRSTEPLL